MHIAYVTETYPPDINGTAITAWRTVSFLRERGHEVQLIRPCRSGETAHDDDRELLTGGPSLTLRSGLHCGFAAPWLLARRFSRTHPDLVHIATQGPLGHAALLGALQCDLPVTTDYCTYLQAYAQQDGSGWLQPIIQRHLRSFHNRAQRTFVPSRVVYQQLATSGFHRLEQIGRGVDSTLFSPDVRCHRLRDKWDASGNDQLVMLYVGRLSAEKNVGLALRAFEIARVFRPRIRMIVVGDGPLRAALSTRFPAVRFVGVQHDKELARHYASADLLLSPGQNEVFGNATLEAMASGLAVVGFNTGAIADLIASRENGIAIETRDESAFIQAVCRCAALGPPRLVAIRHNARETAERTPWEKHLGGFERLLWQTAYTKFLATQRDTAIA